MQTTQQIIDTAIVGAGIAGLSAALFLGRAGRSTVVYDGGKPRIFDVEQVREYLGFDGMKPEEMIARARTEVTRYGVEIHAERVQRIEPREDGFFDVQSASGTLVARSVVLATGVVDELPPLANLPVKWGRDVRVCPCFDGYEVRGQRFVVFGVGARLAHAAAWVSMWSPDVTVVSNHNFNDDDCEKLRLLNIKIVPGEIAGLVHQDEKLVALTTKAGAQIGCDAAWISANSRAASDLAAQLCDVDEWGIAKTDKSGQTSRAGVFAIGNASDGWNHLAHATASGTNVGPIVTMYLLNLRLAQLRAGEEPTVPACTAKMSPPQSQATSPQSLPAN